MRILTLHLKAEYFAQIRDGTKTEEYRLCTPYWHKRLAWREYDAVCICLGYPKADDTERRLIFSWKGVERKVIQHPHFGDKPVMVYAIKLSYAK